MFFLNKKSKREKQNKQHAEQKNGIRKKAWHNTDPLQQWHWVKIILGKLDTIQNPHTNRDTTLCMYIHISINA